MENNGSKKFVKEKGRWKIYELEKNGQPFKILVEGENEGKIKQIMEKPNFKEIEKEILMSGAHVFVDFPERNHIDYYEEGRKTKMEKTPYNFFNYKISGNAWGI